VWVIKWKEWADKKEKKGWRLKLKTRIRASIN
jgi:hypothetical protein